MVKAEGQPSKPKIPPPLVAIPKNEAGTDIVEIPEDIKQLSAQETRAEIKRVQDEIAQLDSSAKNQKKKVGSIRTFSV